jgi:hypothetical protein
MKKLKILVFLFGILLFSIGCSNNDDLSKNNDELSGDDKELSGGDEDILSLSDTNWKLAGFVDVQTDELTEADPKRCETCYTIKFETDSTGFGKSVANEISVILYGQSQAIFNVATEVYDKIIGNVALFYDAIEAVDSYKAENDELKFFYKKDDKPYYLLYKLADQNVVNVKISTIAQGDLPGAGEEGITKQNSIITTESEWNKLKTAMNTINTETNNFTETEIDFAKYQVIAVFDEVKSSGSWSIDITEIIEYSDRIVVTVQNLKKGDITCVMTQPYHIVKIPVTEKKIEFETL